jgi:hypothetical protein
MQRVRFQGSSRTCTPFETSATSYSVTLCHAPEKWSQSQRSENLWKYIGICRIENIQYWTLRQKRHIVYSDEKVYNNMLGKICNFECNYLRIYNNSSNGNRGSVVGMVTRLQTGRSWFRIMAGLRDFYLLYTCPDRLWGPPSLLLTL